MAAPEPEPEPATPDPAAPDPGAPAGSGPSSGPLDAGAAPSPGPVPGADVAPAPSPAVPAMRASDADRERVASILRDAGGDGRLTVHELDERLDAAYGAVTLEQLDGLTTDLVAAPGRAPATAPAPSPGRVVVRDADDGARWLVAVMGGVERKGYWRLGRRCTSLSVMGGTDLDLCDVEFDGQDVHLRVICVMGGAEIRVPDHMNVVVSDVGFMGGNDVQIGATSPDPGGPTLHLHLVSVMGGAAVRRGRKLTRREKRELRSQRRDERRHRHGRIHRGD